ncbi:MAG TPA: ATP-binding cassette domain-containing protein [Coleofasciculaceae cyanobacterium]
MKVAVVGLHPEVPKQEERQQVQHKVAGLGDRLDDYPDQLLGGQKQRVAIAWALVAQPKWVLADALLDSLDKKGCDGVGSDLMPCPRGRLFVTAGDAR